MRPSLFTPLLVLMFALPACSSGGFGGARSVISSGRVPVVSVDADFNDLVPALRVGAKAAELAVLESGESATSKFIFNATLLATDDRIFTFTATQTRAPTENSPARLELTVRGTPHRDLEREKRLLEATKERLEELAGRDWAPLPS
jgi:hypothetical protein